MRYHVKALNKDGAVLALTLDAASAQDAWQIASGQGLSVLSAQTERNFFARIFEGRSSFPLSLFCQELKVLLAAGITLVDALDTLAEREQKSRMGVVLERLAGLDVHGLRLERQAGILDAENGASRRNRSEAILAGFVGERLQRAAFDHHAGLFQIALAGGAENAALDRSRVGGGLETGRQQECDGTAEARE